MIRRDVLDKVGGFDERFHPAYGEDADLGLRVKKAGYRNVCIPAASVLHQWSASTGGGRNAMKMYLVARTSKLLFRKHGNPLLNATTVPVAWLAMCMLEAVAGMCKGDLSVAKAMLQGRWDARKADHGMTRSESRLQAEVGEALQRDGECNGGKVADSVNS